MTKMASDKDFRQALITEGRRQQAKFSWEQTAGKLWECVEKAMKNELGLGVRSWGLKKAEV
jgi:hypothetical protein